MHAAAAIATVMTGMLLSVPVNAASWSDPTIAPTAGPAQVIGRPWNGCLAGAVSLPWDGPGFEVLRPAEHRYFGHPETVGFVERLGREAHAAGLPNFYVGDMAQPRGGPMSSNHVSHETGIDVDIWFTLDTVPGLPVADRTTLEPPPMVLADQSAIDPAQFGPHQVTLLRLAASDPLVDRIFVNPAIKEALCHGYGGAGQGDRTWLERVRPWYGHKAHFHVRLKCPPGSLLCVAQPLVPPGDGCDPAIFAWWAQELSKPKPPTPAVPPARPPLPAACTALSPAN
ncbi:MAG: penicillin-insensitive murein endopeptidase [Alphaproteobacteria bacterium]|nr:penicillin-insensitive murein endopeptidase [Alphaproteobacteria bacterium]